MFKGVAWEQISGFVNRVLMFLGGIAVARGLVTEQLMVQIVGGLMSVAGVLWGIKVNTTSALISSVDGLSQTQAVVLKPGEGALAASIPSPTVVASGTLAAKEVVKPNTTVGMTSAERTERAELQTGL